MTFRLILLSLLGLWLSACSSSSLEGAGRGALSGGAAGAVGGMISAAIFGGDVGEAAARGAAWGASIGAVSGAARGSAEDSARKQRTAREQQSNIEREINRIRAELGEDAFSSLERLVDHKYDAALAYARSAQRSQNSEHALAGLWLEAIGYYDAGREREAGELIPALVAAEPTIASESDARAILVDLHEGLIEIREAFGVPS